jgi:hypothetical protein
MSSFLCCMACVYESWEHKRISWNFNENYCLHHSYLRSSQMPFV